MHSWRLRRSWLQALPHQNPYLLDRSFAHPQQTFHREHDESDPRRTSRAPARAAIVRTRVLAWAVDVEVDPMVGGVVRFVDSGFWRGA
jgi:hypothetical protein